MRNRLCFLSLSLTLALCTAAASAAAQEPTNTREIRGRIVDADGASVQGVRIGTNWSFGPGGATPSWRAASITTTGGALQSDSSGRFSGTLYFRGRPVALVALDVERNLGGTVIVTPDNITGELTLTVGPLRRLRGSVTIETPILRENTVRLYAFDPRAPIALATAVLPAGGKFEMILPPTSYNLSFVANELEPQKGQADLTTKDVQLQPLNMPPTALARLYGKAAPQWTVTAARGVDVPLRIEDFRGRWVLMEYWSYW